jgi:hypothetical protein
MMLRLRAENGDATVRVTATEARQCSRVLADMLDALGDDTAGEEPLPVPAPDTATLRDLVSLCRRFPALQADAPEPYTGSLPTVYRRLADITRLTLAAYRLQSPNVLAACLRTLDHRYVRDGHATGRVARSSVRAVQRRCARLRGVCVDAIADEN